MNETLTMKHGSIRGSKADGVTRFLGVPYAAPLTAANRFLPAQPPQPWLGERDATAYGPTVTQNPYRAPLDAIFGDARIDGDEQLNLNVWTPDVAGSAPVLVWIHGGAFVRGSGSIPTYDGTSFARNGIVCVTINYRLGAPGFLDEGDETANIGLRDQIAALAWVQENISAFGGDPSRVTVAGQSAGAMSIGALLGSPLASGLFEAAILESGAAHHALSRTTARAVATTLADILGVEPDREAFSAVPLDDLLAAEEALDARLRSAPAPASVREVLLNGMPFSPSIDGSVLPQAPLEAIRQGSASSVRLLLGTTTEENRLFLAPGGAIDRVEDGVLDRVAQSYGFPADASVRDLYQDEQDPSPGATLSALQTDWMFRIPAIRLAEAQHEAGGPPPHMYEFAWTSRAIDGALGAAHSVDIPFFFNTLGTPGAERLTGPDAPQALADTMHSAWVSFIHGEAPGWEAYTPERRAVQRFDTTTDTILDPRSEARRAWDGVR